MYPIRVSGWSLRRASMLAPALLAPALVAPVFRAPALHAQDTAAHADRIWASVRTTEGELHAGFLRWDRNEGSWVDLLDGSKTIPDLNYELWLDATGEEPAVRTIDLRGYRISWDEDDPDFPSMMPSKIRFGHLASLTVAGDDRVDLELRGGERLTLEGGATDIGRSIREILIDVPGGEEVELRWRDLERIDFSAAPTGARPRARRLFGTVEDVYGSRYTGWVSWDLDEILTSDVLDGEEMRNGDERDVRFDEIESIERIDGGARVALVRGGALDLTGSNDVDDGHRGVQVSDPDLGMVEIEWRELKILRLHDADAGTAAGAYERFDGGGTLRGTVFTQSGDTLAGTIRWDMDEAATWEILDGRADDVAFSIELAHVARIERGEAFGATVHLRDGRVLELEGTSDVDWDNRGIMVAEDGAPLDARSSWRVVTWEDFLEARFDAVDDAPSGGAGR